MVKESTCLLRSPLHLHLAALVPFKMSLIQGDDDEDDISLTSTTWTEYKDDYNSDKDDYDVEKILAERILRGKTNYLVKWIGYDEIR